MFNASASDFHDKPFAMWVVTEQSYWLPNVLTTLVDWADGVGPLDFVVVVDPFMWGFVLVPAVKFFQVPGRLQTWLFKSRVVLT